MLIGESNVAIDPAIGGYGAADIYLGEFSPHSGSPGDAPALSIRYGPGARPSSNHECGCPCVNSAFSLRHVGFTRGGSTSK